MGHRAADDLQGSTHSGARPPRHVRPLLRGLRARGCGSILFNPPFSSARSSPLPLVTELSSSMAATAPTTQPSGMTRMSQGRSIAMPRQPDKQRAGFRESFPVVEWPLCSRHGSINNARAPVPELRSLYRRRSQACTTEADQPPRQPPTFRQLEGFVTSMAVS